MDLTRHNFLLIFTLGLSLGLAGCSLSPNLNSSIESDELYLNKSEEFITDAAYLQHAYDVSSNKINKVYEDTESTVSYGESCGNSFGNGFGNSWGSNFYGYSPFGYGINNGWGNSFGFSPFGGMNNGCGMSYGYGMGYDPYGWNNGWGMNYGYGMGYDPYGWNNGWGNNNWGINYGMGYGNNGFGWNNWGIGDTYTSSTSIIKPRTPYNTNVISNSTYSGGRAQTNKSTTVDPTPVRKNNTTRTNNSSWSNGYNRGNIGNNSNYNSRNKSNYKREPTNMTLLKELDSGICCNNSVNTYRLNYVYYIV